jgi:GTPase SAR1 family protein
MIIKVPQFKVILIGDSGVGKTSMISRATQGTFDPDNTSNTIGFCFQTIFKEIKDKG